MKKENIYTIQEARYNPQLGVYNKFVTGTLNELTEKLNLKTNSRTIDSLLNKANNKTLSYGSVSYYQVEEGELGFGYNGFERDLLKLAI